MKYDSKPSNCKISIKTSSYTGSNQKTLCTIKMKNGGAILDIKSSQVKYVKYDKKFKENYYKYYYSSRKIVKVKQ